MFLPALNDLSQLPINYIKKEKNRGNFLNGKKKGKEKWRQGLVIDIFLTIIQ